MEEQEKLFSQITKLTSMVIESIKPGMRAADVDRICCDFAKEIGVNTSFQSLSGRFGHGIGMMLTEPPSLSSKDKTVIETGMVLAIEPGTVTKYGTFHIEQDVVITEVGADILSRCGSESLPRIN